MIHLEAKNIIAGNNVTSAIPPGQVLVKNGADVVYKVAESIVLDSAMGSTGFFVEPGGNFFAYISPCGVDCPVPPSNYLYFQLCGDTCLPFNLNLGDLTLADIDISITSFSTPGTTGIPVILSNTSNIFNICLPNNISGGITYIITFKNKICLKESVVKICISYNTQLITNPSINIINVLATDTISYSLQYDPNAITVKTQVYYLDGSQWFQMFIKLLMVVS